MDQVDREQPGKRRAIAGVSGVLALGAAAAVGGYFLGDSTGADLDTARVEGVAAGKKTGVAQGAREGYVDGRKEGRRRGYRETYADSYRAAFVKAYEAAGLNPPKEIEVPD